MAKGLALPALLLSLTACGGASSTPTVVASASPTSTASAFVPEADDPDIDEQAPSSGRMAQVSDSVLKLDTLLTKSSSGFPAQAQADDACVGAVGLVGNLAKDYAELAKQCGTGTGMNEYTRASSGKLDATSHPSDTYDLTMQGGLCYRYFVVGDSSLSQFNVSVQRPNGAVLSIAETKEGVLLLNPKKPWCKHHDREFHIVIEAKGQSHGSYTFGVWARPGK